MGSTHLTAVAALFALLVSMFATPAAHALQILGGDPSCDGFGTCTIDNIDPVVNPVADETYEIILRDMQHIEIFDDDGFDVTIFFGIGSPNTNQKTLTVSVDYGFSDMHGDPIGPDVGGFSTDLLPGEGVGNSIQQVDAPDGGSFILHDFEIFLGCDGCDTTNFLNTSNVNSIVISGVGDNSRVGFWVPEPTSAALLLLGCAGLMFQGRTTPLWTLIRLGV